MSDENVTIMAEGMSFIVSSNSLQANSNYFKAMLSGNYCENITKPIEVSMIPAFAMDAICKFMTHGMLINIEELNGLLELARSGWYLQMDSFLHLVNIEITKRTTIYNWFYIYEYARSADLKDTLIIARNYGLNNFNNFKSEIAKIEDFSFLIWYLSHIELNAANEYEVFLTGVNWLIKKDNSDTNKILALFYCLDFWKMSINQVIDICEHEIVQDHEEIRSIVKVILSMLKNMNISKPKTEEEIKAIAGNNLYYEIGFNILFKSNRRIIDIKFIFPKEFHGTKGIGIFYEKDKICKCLTFLKDRQIWGESIVCWRGTHIIAVCGQIISSLGSRIRYDSTKFKTTIDVYDSVTNCWTIINSSVQPRRHAGVTVDGDDLYIVGGTGSFRKKLNTVWKYKIVHDQWVKLPNLPDDCFASILTVAVYNNRLYVYCNMLIFLDLQQLLWQKINTSGSQHSPLLGPMIFYNDILYFGCESVHQLNCLNIWSKVCKTKPLPGEITSLCLKDATLCVFCVCRETDNIKRHLLKINLRKEEEESELLDLAFQMDTQEEVNTNAKFLAFHLFEEIDKHIIPECIKMWL